MTALVPEAAVALHVARLRGLLQATPGALLYPFRRVDPSRCIDDAGEAENRLADAVTKLELSRPSDLPPWPVATGDRQALLTRTARFAVLGLGAEHAALLATTPLPLEWVGEALDYHQGVGLTRRAGLQDGCGWLLWSLLAAASDALAGTGELPAPSVVTRCASVRPPNEWPPVTRHSWGRPFAPAQDGLLHRSAFWDAAEAAAGGSHTAGNVPVERYVQAWDLPAAVTALTRTDWSDPKAFPLQTVRLASSRTRGILNDWRHSHRDLIEHAQAQLHQPNAPTSRLPPGVRGWFRSPDLVLRCRWRSMTMAGTFNELSQQLERRMMRDVLERYVTATRTSEQTCLPALSRWALSLLYRNNWSRGWTRRPAAEHDRIVNLVLLGYGPGDARKDHNLRSAGLDDLECMRAMTGPDIVGAGNR